MKKTQAVALALAAVLLLPCSVNSAEVNDPTQIGEPSAAETVLPDELTDNTIPEETMPASVDILPSNESLKLPEANPTYKIELTSNSVKVTYPNHETASHDKKYIPLIVNGTLIDSEVILVKDRTLAPLRVLTESLGGTVDWFESTRSITIHKDNDVINMKIGSKSVTINGEQRTIDVPPDIYNNYTYLPLRFVAETLGARVSYNTGEYNPSTMSYKSYKLVQGVTANAIIDQYDASWSVISDFQAQMNVITLSYSLFDQFSKQNNAEHPDKDFTVKYNYILHNIDNTRVVGTVSRYYVVESFSLFLVDKYTGYVYTIGSDSTSNWVKRYAEGDPENLKLFTNIYLMD